MLSKFPLSTLLAIGLLGISAATFAAPPNQNIKSYSIGDNTGPFRVFTPSVPFQYFGTLNVTLIDSTSRLWNPSIVNNANPNGWNMDCEAIYSYTNGDGKTSTTTVVLQKDGYINSPDGSYNSCTSFFNFFPGNGTEVMNIVAADMSVFGDPTCPNNAMIAYFFAGNTGYGQVTQTTTEPTSCGVDQGVGGILNYILKKNAPIVWFPENVVITNTSKTP